MFPDEEIAGGLFDDTAFGAINVMNHISLYKGLRNPEGAACQRHTYSAGSDVQ